MTESTGRTRYGVGDYRASCQLCFKERKRFGVLIDPNGHSWRICRKCIDYLWKKRQALRKESLI